MNAILKIIKTYISTGSFLLISIMLYLFSDSNAYAQNIIELALPINGKPLAFVTFLGLIFVYEACLKNKNLALNGHDDIKSHIDKLQTVIEKNDLINSVNQAFTEFKASGKTSVTGDMYIKEILSLEDRRIKLEQNSYTENKLKYLISVIKYQ